MEPLYVGEKVILRLPTLSDVDLIQKYAGDFEVAKTLSTMPHPYTKEIGVSFIQRSQESFLTNKAHNFAICLKKDGSLIGITGLVLKLENKTAEMGYWLGRNFWNKGYATEAAQILLKHGFDVLKLRKISAKYFSSNHSSGRVMEKLGMNFSGLQKAEVIRFNQVHDLVEYNIFSDNFYDSLRGLAGDIYSSAYLTGEFKLRSGKTSHEYFDKYRFESQPHLLRRIAYHLKSQIPAGVDYLAGLEMGGIPIATALSMATQTPSIFVRKKAKDYGTCQFAEGADIKGKKLCLVEDVVTTGGQILQSAKDLRQSGAIVETVVCAIQRETSATEILKKEGLHLTPLLTMDYIKDVVNEK